MDDTIGYNIDGIRNTRGSSVLYVTLSLSQLDGIRRIMICDLNAMKILLMLLCAGLHIDRGKLLLEGMCFKGEKKVLSPLRYSGLAGHAWGYGDQ